MSEQVMDPAIPTGSSALRPNRSLYALIVLTLVYGLSIVDRSIFGLLLQPIKKEFALSDTVLGLIGSLGFALTYALAGLPLSRLSDRVSRKRVIAWSLACYSLITMLTGAANTAFQLALARIGLAIGESAALPAGTSMISDYFPRKSRSRAMAVLGAGPPIATLFGFTVAGWTNEYFGWRWAFASVGLIGLAMAVLVSLTLHEPIRGGSEDADADKRRLSLKASIYFLLGQRSYLCLVAAGIFTACTMASISAWGPAFLVRIHHFSPHELGTYVGLINGVGGLVGTLIGGVVSDLIGTRDFKWKLLVPVAACSFAAPAILLFLFGDGRVQALCGLTATIALVAMHYGALFATLQSVVRISVRAFSVSVFLVFTTVIGVGLGPVAIGATTDLLSARYAEFAIRYSMIIPACTCFAGGMLLLLAIRFVHGDIEEARG